MVTEKVMSKHLQREPSCFWAQGFELASKQQARRVGLQPQDNEEECPIASGCGYWILAALETGI